MFINKIISNFKLIFSYLKSDIIKKQRSFNIGLISIFLVILFTSLLMNLITVTPVIFLKISEEQVGETDFLIMPFLQNKDASKRVDAFDRILFNETKNNSDSGVIIPGLPSDFKLQFLNFTYLHENLKSENYIRGLTPRWIFQANTSSIKHGIHDETFWSIATMLIINSKLENKYGFGRRFEFEELGLNECYVSETLFKNLQLDSKNITNNTITITINLVTIFKSLGGNFDDLIINKTYPINKFNNPISEKDNKSKPDEFNNYNNNKIDKESQIKNLKNRKNEILKAVLYKIYDNMFINFNNKTSLNEFINSTPLIDDETRKFLSLFYSSKYFKDFSMFNIGNYFDVNLNDTFKKDPRIFIDSLDDNQIDDLFKFEFKLNVKDIIPATSAKWPSVLGNVLAFDTLSSNLIIENAAIETGKKLLHFYFNTTAFDYLIELNVKNYLKNFKIEEFALTVNLILSEKFKIYSGSQSSQRRALSKISGQLIDKLGYDYPIRIELPLYESFKSVEIVKTFMNNIFTSVTVFLWILCIILIYSLMLGNVDEKTYEFGMLRALGYKKSNLILMIIMQALIFSVPAIILALISCYVINIPLSYLIFYISGLKTEYIMNPSTLLYGIIAGLTLPMLASYFPITKALSTNLKEALAIFNKKSADTVIEILKLEKLGISPAALLSSSLLIIIGFATYYIAPLSFFLMDYSIFLFIMNIILLLMIVGLIFMFQLFAPKLQSFVLGLILFFFYKDKNIKFIVLKNLNGHMKRNNKTSIMLMIALSFIIFSGCTFAMIGEFVVNASKNIFGGNIWVNQRDGTDSIDQIKLNEYLVDVQKKFPNSLKNYSYISYPLNEILGYSTKFSSLCNYPMKDASIVSVDSSLINSVFAEIYMISDHNKKMNFLINEESGYIDLVSGLYGNKNTTPIIDTTNNTLIVYPEYLPTEKDENSTKPIVMNKQDILMIIPEGIRQKYSVDINNPGNIVLKKNYLEENYSAKIIGLARKIPGFPAFSSYSTIAQFSPLIISMEQMKFIIDREMSLDEDLYNKIISFPAYTKTPDNIRKQQLIIKFYDNVSDDIKETVYFGIKNFVDSGNTQVVFADDFIKSGKSAQQILEYFFILIGLIALILSFFLVWTSFYCNIKDNICEYGIYRAIGLSKSVALRVYLYEASSLIISSIILGTIIGVVCSTTLVLQFNLFAELPFKSNFPYKLYLFMIITGFLLGLLGSYYPTNEVNKMSLVKILKGQLD